MIKFFCFAVICFIGSQAGRYAVQRNHVLRNHAQVLHGADLHELEDVPEVTHDHSKKHNYDHQFDEIIEDNSYYQNVHNKGFYGPTYPPSYGHKESSGHGLETYGRTFDIKSDFYIDQRNLVDLKHVPVMYAPKVFKAEKVHSYAAPSSVDVHGYTSPAVVHDSRVHAPASVVGAHGDTYSHGVETYGRTFDIKKNFYNDQSNAFDQKHVPAMYVPKVFQAERVHGYAAPASVDVHAKSRQGYAAPVKGYTHNDYKFSGRNTPATAGHYVGYGNKYEFRHGYPYGYGEMLDNTPVVYSLHSGSHRLITKQPVKFEYNIKNDYNNAHAVVDTHLPKGYGL